MSLKWLVGTFVLLVLGGCKDLLNKPLKGEEVDASRYLLAGRWIAEEKGIQLELKETGRADWYMFTLKEPNRLVEGRFMVAYFNYKLALSVDTASITINGEPLVRNDQQGYFLVGAYYKDDELRLVPASMDKFERNFADYFFAAPIEIASFCAKANETCKNTFASGNLLFSKNRRKFTGDFVRYFRTVFPRRDSVIFVPAPRA